MKTVLILDIVSLAILSRYQALAANQSAYGGPWGDPGQSAHVELATGLDPDCLVITMVSGSISIVADQDKVTAKSQASQKAFLENIVGNAMAFGAQLLKEFAAENIAMGITADGKTKIVRQTMAGVQSALLTGSLYDAIDELKIIPAASKDAKYITDARLLVAVNKIETYLGRPLSTSL